MSGGIERYKSSTMKVKLKVFCILSTLVALLVNMYGVNGEERPDPVLEEYTKMLGPPYYPLKIERFFDQLNIPQVFKKKRYVKFLLRCCFFSEPCDIVGKYLKPRLVAAIFGHCLVCTPKQEANYDDWLMLIAGYYPRLFRLVLIKFLINLDVPVPEDERRMLEEYVKNDF